MIEETTEERPVEETEDIHPFDALAEGAAGPALRAVTLASERGRESSDVPKRIMTVADLLPDDLNANQGTVRGLAMLEDSLRTHGAGRSVLVDRNGKLIAGNKTAEGWADIGMEDVIVVDTQGDKLVVVRRLDLDMETDPRARQLGVDDNRTAQVSINWDGLVLQQLETFGVDLSRSFDPSERNTIMQATQAAAENAARIVADATSGAASVPPPEAFQTFDQNIKTDHTCPKCGYEW
jgi:hypothetical protein